MRRLVVPLVLFLNLGTVALGQEPGEKLCGDCHCTGRIPHPHKQSVLDLEKGCIYCSAWMDADPEALCLDWVVCPNCLTPSAQAAAQREFGGEMAKRKAWLETRREKVDKITRTECVHIMTEHFLIAWDIPEIKVGRRILKKHEAAHFYAQRAEEFYAYVLDIHGITEEQTLHTRFELYLLESQRAARALCPYMTNLALQGEPDVQLIGPSASRTVYWDDPNEVTSDEVRHQRLIHTLSHHIHHDICLGEYTFWMFKRYGWMYEGLAFYFEHRLFGPPIKTCSQEAGGHTNMRQKSWESIVKKDVIAGKEPNFQDVIAKGASELSDQDRYFSWSYVDYLMWLDPHQMPALISKMTCDQAPTRDALRDVYGLTIGEFIDGWYDFVKTEYSTRPGKGPIVREPGGGKK